MASQQADITRGNEESDGSDIDLSSAELRQAINSLRKALGCDENIDILDLVKLATRSILEK